MRRTNWRRGLMRLWVILSVAWFFRIWLLFGAEADFWVDPTNWALLITGPIVLFLVGAGIYWAISGFWGDSA